MPSCACLAPGLCSRAKLCPCSPAERQSGLLLQFVSPWRPLGAQISPLLSQSSFSSLISEATGCPASNWDKHHVSFSGIQISQTRCHLRIPNNSSLNKPHLSGAHGHVSASSTSCTSLTLPLQPNASPRSWHRCLNETNCWLLQVHHWLSTEPKTRAIPHLEGS